MYALKVPSSRLSVLNIWLFKVWYDESAPYKTYVNLGNIVVWFSNGTPEGKEHAVFVNSHLNGTLPTPGAAGDALSVGIMLDCMSSRWNTRLEPKTHDYSTCAVHLNISTSWSRIDEVLVWNNAEELLQDGPHSSSTNITLCQLEGLLEHRLFDTLTIFPFSVRAVINLEAAGSKGRELLFQATLDRLTRTSQGSVRVIAQDFLCR